MKELPVKQHLDEIGRLWSEYGVSVIRSGPGTGKTTLIPPFLLSKSTQKILILLPRRPAAKMAAMRVAELLKEEIGQLVGYIFRFEKRASQDTRLLFVTEGTFLKLIQSNPTLDGFDTVILDEFHERHLQTDLALALLRNLQHKGRADLKLMIMSATLDIDELKKYLAQDIGVLDIATALYPLQIEYLENRPSVLGASLEHKVIEALEKVEHDQGDVLVFLPGMGEMLKVKERLTDCQDFEVLLLHGDLSSKEQALVWKESPKQKIILSTNIAESSVTVAGVQVVIDSGLFKEASFNPWSGMQSLEVKNISKASAIQRAGRAARLGPGICFRLYSKAQYDTWPEFHPPSILKSDLAPALLQLCVMGHGQEIKEQKFPWFCPPPLSNVQSALESLRIIGAIDEKAHICNDGKLMDRLPLDPRWAKSMLMAKRAGEQTFLQCLEFMGQLIDSPTERKKLKEQILKMLQTLEASNDLSDWPMERCLLSGHIEQVAKLRIQGASKNEELLSYKGQSLKLALGLKEHFHFDHPYWIVIDANYKNQVTKALAIEEDWFYDLTPFAISDDRSYRWNEKLERVELCQRDMLGKIVLQEESVAIKDKNASTITADGRQEIDDLIKRGFKKYLDSFVNSKEWARLFDYADFFKQKMNEKILYEVVGHYLQDKTHLEKNCLEEFVCLLENHCQGLWDPDARFSLNDLFPFELKLDGHRTIAVHYKLGQTPWLVGAIQDFYGLKNPPSLAKGKLMPIIHLLGPHKRPVQITQDLLGFWNGAYKQMYKELSREYPRHHWPLDPLNAKPVLLKRHLD